jgi:hypothetical protein
MKNQAAMLLGALAIGWAAAPQAMADGSGRIPLPTGNFSLTANGTEASCAAGSCAVLSVIEAGAEVRDGEGNGCGTHAAVVNTVPPGASPPIVVPSVTAVLKVIHYDPTTGTGDESLTEYSGGSCSGAIFNSTGATEVVSGTLHFVISNGGKRIDSVVTALNLSGLGGFSLSFTELQQQSPGNEH